MAMEETLDIEVRFVVPRSALDAENDDDLSDGEIAAALVDELKTDFCAWEIDNLGLQVHVASVSTGYIVERSDV